MYDVSGGAFLETRDALKILRSRGMKIGTDVFLAGMRADKFPFAIAVKAEASWRYLISRKKLDEFLADWCGDAEGNEYDGEEGEEDDDFQR